MGNISLQKTAGEVLRRLVQHHYSTQEQFALDFGMDIRTLSRYINNGIGKVPVMQELAEFFNIDAREFFNPNFMCNVEDDYNGKEEEKKE